MSDSNQPQIFRELGWATHAIHSPKTKKTVNLQVNQLPHRPRSPLLHAFHFLPRASDFRSFLALRVMSCNSEAFHSGPRAGTVTISTCPPVILAVSSCLRLPRESGAYLFDSSISRSSQTDKKGAFTHTGSFASSTNAELYLGPALLKSAKTSQVPPSFPPKGSSSSSPPLSGSVLPTSKNEFWLYPADLLPPFKSSVLGLGWLTSWL